MNNNTMAKLENYLWRRDERSQDAKCIEGFFRDHENRAFGKKVLMKMMGLEEYHYRYVEKKPTVEF